MEHIASCLPRCHILRLLELVEEGLNNEILGPLILCAVTLLYETALKYANHGFSQLLANQLAALAKEHFLERLYDLFDSFCNRWLFLINNYEVKPEFSGH